MGTFAGSSMAGRQRKYTPRVRTQRPLGASMTTNTPPAQPIPEPTKVNDGWYVPAPLSQRLYEKSALGLMTADGGVVLTPEEVMFCHWYRHVPLPGEASSWFRNEVSQRSDVGMRCIAMDVLRNGGELVVPTTNLWSRFPTLSQHTWALRWQRHESWTKHPGYSQIRLHHAQETFDWNELLDWVNHVTAQGHVAELCVVDDEFDATVYELRLEQPEGDQVTVESLDEAVLSQVRAWCESGVSIAGGSFIPDVVDWPLPAVGVPHFSGRFLRHEEHEHLLATSDSPFADLYGDLVSRGLVLRPGFKYGCRWRAYETDIGEEHAPWLVQPHAEAPTNWEEVCLSVRLAEGVNKRWLCALSTPDGYSFLNVKRRV